MFIIDSMDSLVPKNDLEKPPEEANKVAGGALLSSDFLRENGFGYDYSWPYMLHGFPSAKQGVY